MMDNKGLLQLLQELYAFSKSCANSGERLWCGCEACIDLEKRIQNALNMVEIVLYRDGPSAYGNAEEILSKPLKVNK